VRPLQQSLWRDPEFLKLWTGQTISEIGSRITREGIPLTAVILLHATPAEMGLLAALNGFAALLFAPIAGVVADRRRLRPILIWTDLGRAAVLALIPFLHARGNLGMTALYAVMAAVAVLTTFFDVAYQSLLPSLVNRDQLLEGNAKLTMSMSTAEMIGPASTGALVQWLGAPRAIAIDSVSFLLSALSVALIRKAETVRPVHEDAWSWSELSAGSRATFAHPILRAMALRAATVSFFFGFFSTLYVLYAIRELAFTPLILGIVVTLGGIGGFIGSICAHRIAARFTVGATMIGASLVSGALLLLIPLAPGPGWTAILCLGAAQLLGDVSYPVYSIHEVTLRQSIAEPHLLGRVTAFAQLLFKGMWPLGALAGGALATGIGIRPTLALCAAGVLASTLWLYFSPLRDHVTVEG
jgi:predicted MFS family arabinose efflux permease